LKGATPGGVGDDGGETSPLVDQRAENERLRAGLALAREQFDRQRRDADGCRSDLAALRDDHETMLRDVRAVLKSARADFDRERLDLQTELAQARKEADEAGKAAREARVQHLAALSSMSHALEQARARLSELATRRDELAREVIALRTDPDRVGVGVGAGEGRAVRLPVLCRDLARWSDPLLQGRPIQVVAVAVGPPLAPPSLDDLAAVETYAGTLRRLLHTPTVDGKPFHAAFDESRFQLIQAKLREAQLLAERLLSQVERSKNNKDLLWHLMVAKRTDELNRKRR
jgi:hypothetical protein